MKYWKYYLLALLVIVIDQMVKWAVHTYMQPGMPGEIPLLGDWFKLHYTLNPGMAFGVELPPPYGKILLTTFRLIAVSGIAYYIYRLWKSGAPKGLIWCVGAILGGAIGNLIDSIGYGKIYDNAPFGAPTPWFHGQVIDMFYLDLYEGFLPASWPLIGNMHVSLWPIFNVADAAIFLGVVFILINQSKFFQHHEERKHVHQPEPSQHRPDAEAAEVA
ncbi:lipoprotein signal peptidase [Hymenobacter busanensis]|uniref:Lipoprotein signal peptidase n=1 Tax=Hymenobacter busanensis TaxID=2607656 RepID=A0A7L4ZZV5_9BACT|nr:lipoprotein signal peptidase [Hymenobacter busanensis]KAA9332950.1 lipoprotein signal peptidase [Hymenobacter busanensis]QHJ08376.1 lipoprotein signal peptidase [Hymenobacter busanensis]